MYRTQVQLTPTIHDEKLKYYWHIDLITEDGTFTVKHGYNQFIQGAFNDMFDASCEVAKIK